MEARELSLQINPQAVSKIILEFLRDKITRAGYHRAVVGLSGGLDSSVTCLLAAQALGAENVLAVCMPHQTSSPESMDHAALVIKASGIRSITVPITEMVDALFSHLPGASLIRRGNAMARARMIVLYDQSAAFQGLVLGTGNKTEILLGYTTLYGDSACALLPIADLYKTQVRQLAGFLSVPDVIQRKPPSAELWTGQTDEGELGFTYAQVDQLLMMMVEGGQSSEDCVAAGFDGRFVADVLERMRRNQFKRALPPIARMSDRPSAYDFRLAENGGAP